MANQTTVANSAACVGVGLHSGLRTKLSLRPAPAGFGVVFRRTDVEASRSDIALSADRVVDTRLNTTIGNSAGVRVATVEHLLSALAAFQIDNVLIELDGPEVPAMDGSSLPFARMMAKAGVKRLDAVRKVIEVLRPVAVAHGDSHARFEPADGFEVDVTIAFDATAIGRQRLRTAVTPDVFLSDIAAARTFAFLHDYEVLLAAGLAQGGSLENCVVLDDDTVVNEDGLRFDDEFVRHKALDAIGDLFVCGRPIHGRFVAERPGHAVNNKALRALLADPRAWRLRPAAAAEDFDDVFQPAALAAVV